MRIRACVVAFVFTLSSGASMADKIEEPKWQLVENIETVEIRHYEPIIQASTPMKNRGASNSAFRRLAGYIFGGNDSGESIAMTAPVQTTLEDDAPVMAFTMPASFEMQDLPAPDSGDITFDAISERTVAVLRFSGWATEGKVDRKTEELLEVLERQEITLGGEPVLNQYNPPWTLINRRNEIMVVVDL